MAIIAPECVIRNVQRCLLLISWGCLLLCFPPDDGLLLSVQNGSGKLLAYVNAPEDDCDDPDSDELPADGEALLPSSFSACLHGADGCTLVVSGPVEAEEASVVCVVELALVSSVDGHSMVNVVEEVLHPHFGIGKQALATGEALLRAAASMSGCAGGGAESVDLDASLSTNSLNWMSSYLTTRQCRFLPLVKGQLFVCSNSSRTFQVMATEPSGPVLVGPSTVVVFDGLMRSSCGRSGNF